MKIYKYAHSCFTVDVKNCKLLFDPGSMSQSQNNAEGIDAIVITHIHGDHYNLDSIKAILQKNPQAQIITNKEVAADLEKNGIKSIIVGDGQRTIFKDVLIEGMGTKHAFIYHGVPEVENTSYFVDSALFYPGDAFLNPGRPVEILALPTSAPWSKISETLDYALGVKPKKAFPVHDGMLAGGGFYHMLGKNFLNPQNIEFIGAFRDQQVL